MGKDDALCTNFGIHASERSEFHVTIDLASSSLCFWFGACNSLPKTTFIPNRNTKQTKATIMLSDGYKTLITPVDPGRVSEKRRVPVDRGIRVESEKHSPCEQEAGTLRLRDPCNDKDGNFVMAGSEFWRGFCTATGGYCLRDS